MGSKKKKDKSESLNSSSGSESESSHGSSEKCPKRKSKAEVDFNSEDMKKSSKSKKRENSPAENEYNSQKTKEEKKSSNVGQEIHKEGKRRRKESPPQESRDRKFRDDKRMRDKGRYEDRRNRNDDRHRRPNYRDSKRDRRNDKERDYRNRRDDRNYHRDRDRSNNRENYQRRRSRSGSFDHSNAKWGKNNDNKSDKPINKERQKPNFALSGKLTEETNTYRGVVIKYSEPPEARKPKRRWRLYPFKGEKALQTLYIHRESAYLIGRDRKVVDLPVDHPSCSKQHAVLQYRLVPFTRDDGSVGKRVRPYLIDLNSANGTFINNKKIEASKYVELLEKDVIKFGFSSREYVLLHENSKDEAQDDDVKPEDEEVVVKNEAG